MPYYILFILGLLFANFQIVHPGRHQTSNTTTTERTNPQDQRDFIITELQTP